MLRFTLDTNCLIDLEEDRPGAPAIRGLLARHDEGSARVQITATTAAERQRDGTILPDFTCFQARLKAAGLGHLDILKPVAVLDLTYLDWAEIPDDGAEEQARRIHEALFASPFDYENAVPRHLEGLEQARAEHKWRNRRLDGGVT
ncbi:hypothetical protein ACMATS_00105 [Streptoverticillium reticulum]|uniref:hypothetical protein n=1 Tax=Streptoverticillium reticulum TaxID=1433415 RepID=UPI0039BEE068